MDLIDGSGLVDGYEGARARGEAADGLAVPADDEADGLAGDLDGEAVLVGHGGRTGSRGN